MARFSWFGQQLFLITKIFPEIPPKFFHGRLFIIIGSMGTFCSIFLFSRLICKNIWPDQHILYRAHREISWFPRRLVQNRDPFSFCNLRFKFELTSCWVITCEFFIDLKHQVRKQGGFISETNPSTQMKIQLIRF